MLGRPVGLVKGVRRAAVGGLKSLVRVDQVRVRPGAVDQARATQKPEIPEIGMYGIRIRDELDLDLELP